MLEQSVGNGLCLQGCNTFSPCEFVFKEDVIPVHFTIYVHVTGEKCTFLQGTKNENGVASGEKLEFKRLSTIEFEKMRKFPKRYYNARELGGRRVIDFLTNLLAVY